jgi:hypothetical protein
MAKMKEEYANIWVGELREYILGMIVINPRSGECNNASEVKMVASQGFGEMMYAIASEMSPGGLMPDRGAGTTPAAQKVWTSKLIPNASSSKPLDNKEDPVTPDKGDDCEIKHTDKEDFNVNNVHPLDKSYKLNANINVSNLANNHKKFIKHMEQYGIDSNEINEKLYGLATQYFGTKLDFGSYFQ